MRIYAVCIKKFDVAHKRINIALRHLPDLLETMSLVWPIQFLRRTTKRKKRIHIFRFHPIPLAAIYAHVNILSDFY